MLTLFLDKVRQLGDRGILRSAHTPDEDVQPVAETQQSEEEDDRQHDDEGGELPHLSPAG